MSQLQLWFLAIRPKTLPAGISPVLIGLAIAYKDGAFFIIPAILTLFCTMMMQSSANLLNDYYDFCSQIDDEKRLGPLRVSQQRFLSAKRVRLVGLGLLGLSFIVGLFLTFFYGGWPLLVIGIFSTMAAYCYTGGPYPLSHYGLGEFLAYLFFGPVAVGGTYFLQTQLLMPKLFLYGSLPGFLSAAIMAINNLRDREGDLRHGKRTIPNLLSEKTARFFILLLLISPFLLAIFFDRQLLYPGLILLLYLPLCKNILLKPISSEWNNYLAQTGRYLFLYALLFSATVVS